MKDAGLDITGKYSTTCVGTILMTLMCCVVSNVCLAEELDHPLFLEGLEVWLLSTSPTTVQVVIQAILDPFTFME